MVRRPTTAGRGFTGADPEIQALAKLCDKKRRRGIQSLCASAQEIERRGVSKTKGRNEDERFCGVLHEMRKSFV